MNESTLSHHGILGMRWGIRRHQPYPKGHKGGKEIGEAVRKKKRKEDPIKKMSNDELRRKVKRLEMEKKYKELTKKEPSKLVKFGKRVVEGIIIVAATEAVKNYVRNRSEKGLYYMEGKVGNAISKSEKVKKVAKNIKEATSKIHIGK